MAPGRQGPAGEGTAACEAACTLLSETAPVVVGVVDTDETILDLGGALLDRLGHRPEPWVGRRLSDVVDDATVLGVLREGLAGRPAEKTTVLNDRTRLLAARPVLGEAGEVTAAVAVLTYADQGDVHRELTVREAWNEQFAALIELSTDFIAIADLDGAVTYVNRAGRRLVGLETDEEALGRPTDDYFTDRGRALSREIEDAVWRTGSWQGESELHHFGTGEPIPVSVDSFLVTRSSDGRPLALATVQRDLRSRLHAEEALAVRVSEQRAIAELGRLALTLPLDELMGEAVRLLAARYPDLECGVMQRQPDGRHSEMVACSRLDRPAVTLPVTEELLIGRAILENRLVHTDDVLADARFPPNGPTTRLGIRTALVCPIPGGDGPWGAVGASGAEPRRWSEDDLAFVESVAATLGAAVHRDDLEERLRHQALHDTLTGLPNRALVLDRIGHAMGRAGRHGSMLAVLLLDLDDFKAVNDSLGHSTGDQLLADVAVRLECVVRQGDTVARLGGDEFVVVCEDVGCEQEVGLIAEALLAACGTGVETTDQRLALSASIGVAVSASGAGSTTSLLSEADIAMHRAKRDRPGTYRIFDEVMRGEVLGRINTASSLRSAVRAGELDIAYQPIVDLSSGRLVAMEALARWTNRAGRAVPPDVFVRVAEETGIIGELGRQILRGAARQAVTWQPVQTIGVRVNASALELRAPDYVDGVLAILDSEGLPAGLLGLEITESTFIDEDKTTQDNLSRLREAGVCLLIDDFGTGYSSLSYLQRFPVVDVLKVDRSFLGEGTRGEAVVQAVIGLGRAFGLKVCAEGVETPEQHARVTELGCDFAQGYLLGRPVPSDRAHAVVAAWKPRLPPTSAR